MKLNLGIDAGGTYTDAIVVRSSDDAIIASYKALTTYPDPLEGIREALDGVDQDILSQVDVVSVSTTLSTNTILEGTGFPVGLILVGDFFISNDLPTEHFVQVKGGHNHRGGEAEPLDENAVKEFARKAKENVSAFAVSSYFSIRNNEHELRVKEIIRNITGMPVVCAHELSQDLGAFERAVTAFFNAQLLPITEKFMSSVETEIRNRGMKAKIFMLKCDGSVTGIKSAVEKPIESIFSGPAGSLVGASFLSKRDTCAVIDVGGTSTDVSVIRSGVPEMSESGAVVGGWKTRVKAIRMETSALGGDSDIWIGSGKVNFGPRRVIPLCRAAAQFPKFLEQIATNPMPSKALLGRNFQPAKFYIRTDYEPLELTELETEILNAIPAEPTSLKEIRSRINKYPASKHLDNLMQKRLIQPISFTPTDALHVLGEYTEYNAEASRIGAEHLAPLYKMEGDEFAAYVKREFAKNMAADLVSFFLEKISREEIRNIFDVESPIQFKVHVPVVLIGGPVVAYLEEMKKLIDAEIILPEFANVGNAAGALAAKGIRRVEILIRPASMAAPEWEFYVYSEKGRENFYEYEDAVEHAISLGKDTIYKYMKEADLDPDSVKIDIKKDEVLLEGLDTLIEAKIVVLGVAEHIEEDE
ncbi:hydantoinase/oxoprolinase family protein [Methanococcoides orientis]|uniref:hydantoinase/oxoprolinase family protein n=1 Tax=Methanococcoides orientis TaxID=2822137 RepID=UPI001E48D0F3|nr:hydantoinase/oxoprolinase family protein [Methanococcoides orientis]UGV40973.1 hydantoinase/oxoprolinase family protein [Methanococcoides orientis]